MTFIISLSCLTSITYAEWHEVIADPSLVAREAPSVGSSKLGNIPYGGKVNVVEKMDKHEFIGGREGDWVKIQWKNTYAYVFDAFLGQIENKTDATNIDDYKSASINKITPKTNTIAYDTLAETKYSLEKKPSSDSTVNGYAPKIAIQQKSPSPTKKIIKQPKQKVVKTKSIESNNKVANVATQSVSKPAMKSQSQKTVAKDYSSIINLILMAVVILSTIWVYFDTSKHKIKKIKGESGFFNVSAITWVFATLILWIICFPAYLLKRKSLIEKSMQNTVKIKNHNTIQSQNFRPKNFMFCSNCGSQNTDGNKFCPSCGTNVNLIAETETLDDIKVHSVFGIIAYSVLGIIAIPVLFGVFKAVTASDDRKSTETPALTKVVANPTSKRGNDTKILNTIWRVYKKYNHSDINKGGYIVKRGTVPPRAMNSSVDRRLPAYLACYKAILVSPYGDSQVDMCVYYINNPIIKKTAVQWKGKRKINELESFMQDDGFVEE